MRRTPALIVGGGPAGAAAAITLARAGMRHLLVERTRETGDALCGGFLSWRSLEALAALGIEADLLNPERIDRVRLFAGIRCAEAALPAPALAVSRHRLDTLLLARAEAEGAAIARGVAVRGIDGTEARTGDGALVTGDALLLASGKHDIRGTARPAPRDADPSIGLRLRLAPSATLARMLTGAIELHLVDRGYVGIALQEDGSANVCLAIHRSRLDAAGSPAALIAALGAEAPALGERLAFAAVPGIDAIANIPYGWRARGETPGIMRLGDQAGVIPSLAGEGMGIALASGVSAAVHLARTGSAAGWQPGFARRLARPLAVAGLVRRLAEGPFAPAMTRLASPALIQIIATATRVGH